MGKRTKVEEEIIYKEGKQAYNAGLEHLEKHENADFVEVADEEKGDYVKYKEPVAEALKRQKKVKAPKKYFMFGKYK